MRSSGLKSILKNRLSRRDDPPESLSWRPDSKQSNANFSRLPDELLEIIITQIQDQKTLYCLSQVCRRLQGFAEIVLYKSILIRTGTQAKRLRLATERDPERATYIHILDLRCDLSYEEGWHGLEHVLARARNLHELVIESSACSYTSDLSESDSMEWDSIERALCKGLRKAKRACGNCDRGGQNLHCCLVPTQGLAHLSKLTLHLASQRSRFWDAAGQWDKIMAMSTLQDLTISCACVHDGMNSRGRKTSTLKRLTLIECNITISGFLILLSMPEALEELHVGENRWRITQGIDIPAGTAQPYNVLTYRSPTAFMDALEFQCDSLRRLSYDVSFTEGIPRKRFRDARFDRFRRLEEVRFNNLPESFERAMFEAHTPPELRSVRLELSWKSWSRQLHVALGLIYAGQAKSDDIAIRGGLLMYACETALQILENLHVVITAPPVIILITEARRMLQAGRQWWRRGVKLCVYFIDQSNYLSPYLYNDVPPKELLVFEGGKGFVSTAYFCDGDYDLERYPWIDDVTA